MQYCDPLDAEVVSCPDQDVLDLGQSSIHRCVWSWASRSTLQVRFPCHKATARWGRRQRARRRGRACPAMPPTARRIRAATPRISLYPTLWAPLQAPRAFPMSGGACQSDSGADHHFVPDHPGWIDPADGDHFVPVPLQILQHLRVLLQSVLVVKTRLQLACQPSRSSGHARAMQDRGLCSHRVGLRPSWPEPAGCILPRRLLAACSRVDVSTPDPQWRQIRRYGRP